MPLKNRCRISWTVWTDKWRLRQLLGSLSNVRVPTKSSNANGREWVFLALVHFFFYSFKDAQRILARNLSKFRNPKAARFNTFILLFIPSVNPFEYTYVSPFKIACLQSLKVFNTLLNSLLTKMVLNLFPHSFLSPDDQPFDMESVSNDGCTRKHGLNYTTEKRSERHIYILLSVLRGGWANW